MSVNLGQNTEYEIEKMKEYVFEHPDDMPADCLEEPAGEYIIEKNKYTGESFRISFYKRILAMMGIESLPIYREINSEIDFIPLIRSGVPKEAIDHLADISGFSPLEMARIMRTSDRTLRRYTQNQKLNAEQSERVIELAKLYSRGEEVFGSIYQFNEWMNNQVIALGNKKPKEYLDTSIGIEMLIDELGRIEHGIFA